MNVLVTYGGTKEPIDNVRYIANTSSGALGAKIADAFFKANCRVVCLKAFDAIMPAFAKNQKDNLVIKEFFCVADLQKQILCACKKQKFDVVVHLAAVSDYYVQKAIHYTKSIKDNLQDTQDSQDTQDIRDKYSGKLPSSIQDLCLLLKPTPKIIAQLRDLNPKAKIIGFKLLCNVAFTVLEAKALEVLQENHLDYVVANDSTQINNSNDKHKAFLFSKQGLITQYNTKDQIATGIVSLFQTP